MHSCLLQQYNITITISTGTDTAKGISVVNHFYAARLLKKHLDKLDDWIYFLGIFTLKLNECCNNYWMKWG